MYVSDYSYAFHIRCNRHLGSICVNFWLSLGLYVKPKTVLLAQKPSEPILTKFLIPLKDLQWMFSFLICLCLESLKLLQNCSCSAPFSLLSYLQLVAHNCPCRKTWNPESCWLPMDYPWQPARLRWVGQQERRAWEMHTHSPYYKYSEQKHNDQPCLPTTSCIDAFPSRCAVILPLQTT